MPFFLLMEWSSSVVSLCPHIRPRHVHFVDVVVVVIVIVALSKPLTPTCAAYLHMGVWPSTGM